MILTVLFCYTCFKETLKSTKRVYNQMNVTNSIKYIGVNDYKTDLFEGQYKVPAGMSYNSYIIFDDKIAVMDTVDIKFKDEWLENLKRELAGRTPDYLVVQHMEPDHSANVTAFMKTYPNATVVASDKAFKMMYAFFGDGFENRRITVGENDTLSLGKRTLHFITAPMVHWPEVIVTYDDADKVLFSADGFGKFGALDADEEWICEARRYYFGIVGKYGTQVQTLLKKAAALDIKRICPLHGPILGENLDYYLNLYDLWSSYGSETDGIVIAYTSVYKNTEAAVKLLAESLKQNGCTDIKVFDLARDDMSQAVAYSFAYGKTVLATTTYNSDIFPFMKEFINHLTERGFKNKTVALIENGSWAPVASKVMMRMLENCKNITYTDTTVKIISALDEQSTEQIKTLSAELTNK